MSITIQQVQEKDKDVLYNLYSLYLHDLSRYTNSLEIKKDGSFELDVFASIWETDGLSPYFLYSGDSLIGFILLVERPFLEKEYDYSINDIFILNKYRGKGFALQAIDMIFQQKKGRYFIIELVSNVPAVHFWKIVYDNLKITFEEIEQIIDEDPVLIQTFQIQ
ncbi:GNAT family N-acetyltransferase [Bacillus sp. BGMRC 2118]|nr:GNAT family N-acetyltransferase [Bacillus sp. BGMRC 2118]